MPVPWGSAVTPLPPACLPACLRARRGTGLKVIHLIAAVWSLASGKEEEGEGTGSPWENSPAPSLRFFFSLVFPRPKNTLAEDTFNNIFLLKKYSNKLSICPSILPRPPGAEAEKGSVHGAGPGGLGAVGLLLLKQRHGQLGAAPQPLQVAEAAAVVEFLAEPRAAVPQGELLHQPWLHGPEEVEP